MCMCIMLSHLKAKTILNTLQQLKILGQKTINNIMNDMGMNHSLHIGTYAECINFHAISNSLYIS